MFLSFSSFCPWVELRGDLQGHCARPTFWLNRLIDHEIFLLYDCEPGHNAVVCNLDLWLAMNSSSQDEVTVVSICNFLLNLEYLEAAFFSVATNGERISADVLGGKLARVEGGDKVKFENRVIEALCWEIDCREREHIKVLRGELGGTAAPCPPLNIGLSFSILARESGMIQQSQTFNPYQNDTNFLFAAYMIKSVCANAYLGIVSCTSDPVISSKLADILSEESSHAGMIKISLLHSQNKEVLAAMSCFDNYCSISSTSDKTELDEQQVVLSKLTKVKRKTSGYNVNQVLNVLYGIPNAAGRGGAFFPNGFNGLLR